MLFLFCSERAQNKKTQPCGAYRLMKLLLLNRLQASRRREGFFRCRPLTGNGNDFPLCVLCASKERSERAVNYYSQRSEQSTTNLPKWKVLICLCLTPFAHPSSHGVEREPKLKKRFDKLSVVNCFNCQEKRFDPLCVDNCFNSQEEGVDPPP